MAESPPLTKTGAGKPARQSALRWLIASVAPFLGLFIVVAIFYIYGKIIKPDSTFLTAFRLALIAKQTAIVGMGALGMTIIIIAGGIDLSVGSMLALTTVVLAKTLNSGNGAAIALAATLAAGVLAGLFNAILITILRLVPFIVTLGTMLLFRGVAEQLSDQRKVSADAPAWIASLLDPPSDGSFQFFSSGVWLVILFAFIVAGILRYTTFGRHVVAIGSNESAARLCGIPIHRVKIAVYAIGGFFMALAGMFEFANLNKQGNPTSGIGLELDIIAAVVIGGGSLNGGRGSVAGSLVGALMMTTLRNGCVFAEVPDPIQKIVIGAIIVGAVAIDQLRERSSGAKS
ncbi:MAG: ABC transporter permease [Planctomycetes bacterium]|nr:ABC transporter permease [Planctomycetota bacterium]